MGEEQQLHKSHRERLRTRYLAAGLSDFAPHNVLELLLFYAIPRRDTNPTAHALLSRFGSVEGVLTAAPEALASVPGVGPGSARFLSLLWQVGEMALSHRPAERRLGSADALGRYFSALLDEGAGERVALLFLDNDFGEISHRVIDGVSIHSPRFSPSTVVEEALLRHAPLCAVAHRHGDGLALPTGEDLDLTQLMRGLLDAAGVRLVEHMIVGGGRYATLLYRYSGKGKAAPAAPERRGPSEEEVTLLGELLKAAHLRAEAAALLAPYGSLYRLLSAPCGRHRFEGVGESCAALLSLVLAVNAYCAAARPVPSCRQEEALGEYLSSYYRAVTEETVLLLLFDKSGRHLGTHTVGVGSIGEATISCRRVAEGALFAGAQTAVLAHNHPSGTATPSEEDRVATDVVGGVLGGLGVTLLRHYVVAKEGFSLI